MGFRFYLLNPPFKENFVRCGRWQGVSARGGTFPYPIWLAYSTGILEQEGHDVRLVDAVALHLNEDEVLKDAVAFKPDFVVVDSNFSSLGNDQRIALVLGEKTKAKTIIVGPPSSQYADKILAAGIDIVARFEYDLIIRDLARALGSNDPLSAVDGISYRYEGMNYHNKQRSFSTSEELDSIPFVTKVYKEHLNINDYFSSNSFHPMVQIITSRGCPNQCTFCSWTETFTGRAYRGRNVRNIVDEFEYVVTELPQVKEIFIDDDSFTIDKQRVRDFCQELMKRDISISWGCESRATLDYDLMKLMKKSGCRILDVGYESGSDEMLRRIRKGTTTDQLIRFTKDAKRARLKIQADFVFGFHGETKEMAAQTKELIKTIRPDLLQIAIATPIPGTEFYNWCRSNGYLRSEDLSDSIDQFGFQQCLVSYPWLSHREIEDFVRNTLREYYLSPQYLFIAFKGVLNRNFVDEMKIVARSSGNFITFFRSEKNNGFTKTDRK